MAADLVATDGQHPHGGELINGYHDVPVFEIDCSDSGFSEFGHYPNNYVCCIARNY